MSWLDSIAPDLTRTNDFFSDRWKRNEDDGKTRREPPPVDLTPGPTEIDYSMGFPMDVRRPAKNLMDEDLQAFQQRNPLPPAAMPQMAPQSPIPGLLGPQISAVPPGVGGNPVPPPPAPPPLPAPTVVGPPPGGVPPVMAAGSGPPPAAPPGVTAPSQMPTDVSAQSRPPPGAEMPPQGGPGLLQRFDAMTQRNPALLLALASGFAGAPSFGTGMSRAFGNAANALPIDQKVGLENSKVAATYRALVKAGLDPQTALAAAQNPAVLQQVGPDYLGTRKSEIKSIKSKDMFGNETEKLVSINPYTQEVTELKGQGGRGGTDLGGGNTGVFAPGITQENFNHNAVGEDYLKQFHPEAQQAAKDYLAGRTIQTGRQLPQQAIKMIAQKYGNDIGMPADDTAINQRKQWATSLGDTKSGVGLQAKGFSQGLEHMKELSDKLVKQGNTSALGIEPVASAVNSVKNLTTGQADIGRGITASSGALAGEVGKLFSGATGGGVHERERTQQLLGNLNQSGPASAGALESTMELMDGGLRTLERRRDELFPGGGAPRGSDFNGPYERKLREQIQRNIEILRGNAQPEAAPQAARASTGVQWKVIQP